MLSHFAWFKGSIVNEREHLSVVSRSGRWPIVFLLAGLIVGCQRTEESTRPSEPTTANRVLSPAVESAIETFCGDCHRMPLPSSFPKSAWRDEVQRGFDFYYASRRTDLEVPVQADVHHYFVSRAPQELQLPAAAPLDAEWVSRYRQVEISLPDAPNPAVSFIGIGDLGESMGRGLVLSDMRLGGVYFVPIDSGGQTGSPRRLAKLDHPAAIRIADWDRDGLPDLVVADLGSFLPEDHDRGRVVWLQQREDAPGEFHPHTLQAGLGRVASVEIADLDGDGWEDLLVAEFGWQTTGSIFWLQRAPSGDPLEGLVKRPLDPREGSIHLPVADLNGDGAPDFVALISQHYEQIQFMINDGRGRFSVETIYEAPCPSYGSSGIDLVDLNGNGRLDILYTNGDSFDSFILKPFHGVKWFENRGDGSFVKHDVGSLPGAHRALAGDLDGDGSLEIVAGSFIPRRLLVEQRQAGAEALVVWKRDQDGQYTKHVLSKGDCVHAALHLADLDGDGRDDLIVGRFDETESPGPAVTIWYSRPAP
ncbi:MAG: VCBS repeat-containing protein [Planctomycetaceae bacterium]|nr:MAG: VCBS repeat-containing protein [Planctomycetaceae bacterium]